MGLQRVGHDWATELTWIELTYWAVNTLWNYGSTMFHNYFFPFNPWNYPLRVGTIFILIFTDEETKAEKKEIHSKSYTVSVEVKFKLS